MMTGSASRACRPGPPPARRISLRADVWMQHMASMRRGLEGACSERSRVIPGTAVGAPGCPRREYPPSASRADGQPVAGCGAARLAAQVRRTWAAAARIARRCRLVRRSRMSLSALERCCGRWPARGRCRRVGPASRVNRSKNPANSWLPVTPRCKVLKYLPPGRRPDIPKAWPAVTGALDVSWSAPAAVTGLRLADVRWSARFPMLRAPRWGRRQKLYFEHG